MCVVLNTDSVGSTTTVQVLESSLSWSRWLDFRLLRCRLSNQIWWMWSSTNTFLHGKHGVGTNDRLLRELVRSVTSYAVILIAHAHRASTRKCDRKTPEDLDLTGLTHLNFAFAFFDPTSFQISPMDSSSASLYSRFTALKQKSPSLQTWISIGGWSFNDDTNIPNTRTAFSDMCSSAANRQTFISALTKFMVTYGFDGVDLDWE